MKDVKLTIEGNKALTKDVYKMTLYGDCSDIKAPGQFVNIKIDGLYLRRPISVCDMNWNELTLIYKVVGKGTLAMSKMVKGMELQVLTGLGNGYDMADAGDKPLLIGGGVGVPPLYNLARLLIEKGVKPTVILGFNMKDEIFYKKEFEKLGCEVRVTTIDGSE